MYTLLTFNAALAIYALVRLLTDSQNNKPIGSQIKDYVQALLKPGPAELDSQRPFSYQDMLARQTGVRGWITRIRLPSIKIMETDLAWVAFILFSTATLLTHNTALLFPLATNIFVLGLMLLQKGKEAGSTPTLQAPSIGNWIKAQVGIFLLWSPWLYPFFQQARRVYLEFWLPKPAWKDIVQVLKSFLNELTHGEPGLMLVVWILYALVLILGLLFFRKRASMLLLLSAFFAIPFLGELIVSIQRPIFYDKTLIWTTIPLFLILAAGIVQMRFRLLILLVVGIFCAINLMSTADYFRFYYKEDWATPAGYVANFAEEGDLVLFNAGWVQIPFDYYFKYFEELYKTEVVKHGVPEDMFESGILEPIMLEKDIPRLMSLLEGRERAWLVYSHNWYTDPEGLIPQTLGSNMDVIRQRDFYGGQVFLYGIP